jgi:hypothetical protein
VEHIEECREREVLKGSIPVTNLPDTGGPPLLLLPWVLALGAAGMTLVKRR